MHHQHATEKNYCIIKLTKSNFKKRKTKKKNFANVLTWFVDLFLARVDATFTCLFLLLMYKLMLSTVQLDCDYWLSDTEARFLMNETIRSRLRKGKSNNNNNNNQHVNGFEIKKKKKIRKTQFFFGSKKNQSTYHHCWCWSSLSLSSNRRLLYLCAGKTNPAVYIYICMYIRVWKARVSISPLSVIVALFHHLSAPRRRQIGRN